MNARVAVVVGNPKPVSRTYEAALTVAERLGGADLVIDLADHTGELVDWSSATIAELVEEVATSEVVVVASVPTRGLFVLDSEHADAAPYDRWFADAEPLLPTRPRTGQAVSA